MNADLVRAVNPDVTLLVAPDRLGVLHEVLATHRAASTAAVDLDGIVLVAPERPDSSTGLNAGELGRVLEVPVVAVVGRATPRGSRRDRTSSAILAEATRGGPGGRATDR